MTTSPILAAATVNLTIHYAARVQSCLALERSSTLRTRAQQRFSDAGLKNVELAEGDVAILKQL